MVCPVDNRQVYHSHCALYPDEEIVRRRDTFGVFIQALETGEARQIVRVTDCWEIHLRRDEIADWHLSQITRTWAPICILAGHAVAGKFYTPAMHLAWPQLCVMDV